MESAAENLEKAFKDANAKLDAVENRVDQAWKDAGQNLMSVPEMQKNLQLVKTDFKQLVADVDTLKEAQEASIGQMIKDLQTATEAIEGFKQNFGDVPQ